MSRADEVCIHERAVASHYGERACTSRSNVPGSVVGGACGVVAYKELEDPERLFGGASLPGWERVECRAVHFKMLVKVFATQINF